MTEDGRRWIDPNHVKRLPRLLRPHKSLAAASSCSGITPSQLSPSPRALVQHRVALRGNEGLERNRNRVCVGEEPQRGLCRNVSIGSMGSGLASRAISSCLQRLLVIFSASGEGPRHEPAFLDLTWFACSLSLSPALSTAYLIISP